MKTKINYKYINILIVIIIFIISILFLNYIHIIDMILNLIKALIPFYIGIFLSWLLMPISRFMNLKLKINKGLANCISLFLSIIVIIFVLLYIIPQSLLQAGQIFNNFSNIWNSFLDNLNIIISGPNSFIHNINNSLGLTDSNISFSNLIEKIDATQVLNYILSSTHFITDGIGFVGILLKGTIGFILEIVMGYAIAFYFMGTFHSFADSVLNLAPKKHNEKIKKIVLESSATLFMYIRGLLIISTFMGVATSLGAAALGIPSPLLFGFIVAITDVIPYLGVVLGGAPLFVVALSIGIMPAVAVVLLISLLHMIEAYILQPKVMSKATKLHPAYILVNLLICNSLFGFVGLIIGTPLLIVVKVIVNNTRLQNKIKI